MRPWSQIAAATGEEHQRLLQGLQDCAGTQRRQLIELLRSNADSAFGRAHDFEHIDDADSYRARVPLRHYADLAADIDAMAGADPGSDRRLLAEPIRLFEETGGSSGGPKLVPYTDRSLAGFRHALHPWLHDLARHYTGLGCSYFAISPAARPARTTAAGIPIGTHDAAYFGAELTEPLAAIALLPEQLATITDLRQWQRLSLGWLLRADDLTLISIWSPSFILSLLDALPALAEGLLRELRDGVASPLAGVAPLPPRPQRATLVERALAAETLDTQLLWSRLQLLSCWTDAVAARFIPALRRLFPQTAIQGKGLLSTEAVVSLPLGAYQHPVLAVNSGFYEFLDSTGRSWLADEVEPGEDYELALSVPGLYRYRSGDRVRVLGRAGSAPQLRFIGRAGLVSDRVGEKLDEAFVTRCLQGIDGFAMLAPATGTPPHYRLYCERVNPALADQVEQALRDNPQYAYARDLGQLGPLTLTINPGIAQRYQDWALARGQRLGDIKPPSLCPEFDWGPPERT